MLMGGNLLLQGVVASGIAFAVQIWCIDRGGPVFVAVYQPVQTLVVAIMASVALGEEFYLGGWVPSIIQLFISQCFLYLSRSMIPISFPNRKIKFNLNRIFRVYSRNN